MQDRYLAYESHLARTPLECYHWSIAVNSLNQELPASFDSYNLDAIWITAAFMSMATVFTVETDDYMQVWPLKPATASDLSWLGIQKGMRTLWERVNSQQSASLFRGYTPPWKKRCLGVQLPSDGIDGIWPPLLALCDLDQFSNASNNPYYSAAHMLSLLLKDDVRWARTLRFMAFPNTMEPGFEDLLRCKDPRALVILAVWYEIIEQSTWWMSGRAALERQAIWIYLHKYYADHPRIRAFITSPITTSEWTSQHEVHCSTTNLHCNLKGDWHLFREGYNQNKCGKSVLLLQDPETLP